MDDNDKFTSFLFNLLSESIVLREYSYDLLDFSETGDWVPYTRSLAGIIRSIIYFESSSSYLDPNIDPDSPYYTDKKGNLLLKEEVHQFIDDKDNYRQIYNTVHEVHRQI